MNPADKWKAIQAALDLPADGMPGNQTADAVAARLGISWDASKTQPLVVPFPKPATAGAEPPWLVNARRHIGLREIPGPKHHAQILKWWSAIRAPFIDDETPWCAAFVGGIFEAAGVRSTRSAAARSYANDPDRFRKIKPAQGAVVVFWRGTPDGWSGHVAFLAGVSATGDLWVIGGNQGDAVTLAKFPPARVIGYYWPADSALDPAAFPVRRFNASGDYSRNEA